MYSESDHEQEDWFMLIQSIGEFYKTVYSFLLELSKSPIPLTAAVSSASAR